MQFHEVTTTLFRSGALVSCAHWQPVRVWMNLRGGALVVHRSSRCPRGRRLEAEATDPSRLADGCDGAPPPRFRSHLARFAWPHTVRAVDAGPPPVRSLDEPSTHRPAESDVVNRAGAGLRPGAPRLVAFDDVNVYLAVRAWRASRRMVVHEMRRAATTSAERNFLFAFTIARRRNRSSFNQSIGGRMAPCDQRGNYTAIGIRCGASATDENC